LSRENKLSKIKRIRTTCRGFDLLTIGKLKADPVAGGVREKNKSEEVVENL